MASNYRGKVKWFSAAKGYGFIEIEGQRDIFVRFSAIERTGYKSLDTGQDVQFNLVNSDKGPMAANVITVPADEEAAVK